MTKRFDVLAEGLLSKNSWDDKTAMELFRQGVGIWASEQRRIVILE